MGETPTGGLWHSRFHSNADLPSFRHVPFRFLFPLDRVARLLRSAALVAGVAAAVATGGAATLAAQVAAQAPRYPFAVGEALDYQVRVSRLGDVGTGRMWIEGPEEVAGVAAWRLRFEMSAGKGPIRASDRTSSWVDPRTLSTLRYEKRERHLLSRSDEEVTIDLAARTWTDAEGPSGVLATDRPLDELSFLYYLRTLVSPRDTTLRLDRHFDADRNPILLHFIGRDTLTTPAGVFRTRIIEMEVRDPKRYKGTGVIRLHISEGDCPMLVRMESKMPLLGTTTLTLTGWAHPPGYPAAIDCVP